MCKVKKKKKKTNKKKISKACMESNDTFEVIYETETDSQTKNTLPRGTVSRGGMDWEFGISQCRLLYICIAQSLCCTPEMNTNCKSAILSILQ